MKYALLFLITFLSSCSLFEVFVPPDTDKEEREELQKIKPYCKVEGFYSNGLDSSSYVKDTIGLNKVYVGFIVSTNNQVSAEGIDFIFFSSSTKCNSFNLSSSFSYNSYKELKVDGFYSGSFCINKTNSMKDTCFYKIDTNYNCYNLYQDKIMPFLKSFFITGRLKFYFENEFLIYEDKRGRKLKISK